MKYGWGIIKASEVMLASISLSLIPSLHFPLATPSTKGDHQ